VAAQNQCRAVCREGGHRSAATCPRLPPLSVGRALEGGTSF